jgi:hypothetical protein
MSYPTTTAEDHQARKRRNINVSGDDSVTRREVGTLDLLDLQLINERYGRDPLPYPFMLTEPTRFEFVDELAEYASHLPERLRSGDLSVFAKCLDAWTRVDVTVTGHVQHIPGDTPSIRLLAFRAGQVGYLLEQRTDADVIEVSTLSPFELGAAIAQAMGLEAPGRHTRIVIPEFLPSRRAITQDDDDVVVRHDVIDNPGAKVPVSHLTALGTVQSSWRPAREWGIDTRRPSVTWMRMWDDGEYLGVPDRSRGIPLTVALLRDRIDNLIADDIAMLREFREES